LFGGAKPTKVPRCDGTVHVTWKNENELIMKLKVTFHIFTKLSLFRGESHVQGSCKVWKSMDKYRKSFIFFQPGKVWKKFFWSVSMKKGKYFSRLDLS